MEGEEEGGKCRLSSAHATAHTGHGGGTKTRLQINLMASLFFARSSHAKLLEGDDQEKRQVFGDLCGLGSEIVAS